MKVLIAEDEPVSRRLLQGHLERWGHEVTAAATGGEAWRLFEAGSFPLVITDWMMPEIDGLELVRRVRAFQRPGYVYIIMLTARARKEDIVEGIEAGANDFVTKPFDREELRVRLGAGELIIQLEQTLARQNQTLRETQAALVQNEKLASLGRLAAGLAHEINNPIAYVSNNLAVLRRDMQAALDILQTYQRSRDSLAQREPALAADLDHREKEMDLPFFQENFLRMCDKSLEGLQRVRQIVNNLRDFARLDEAPFKEIDLNQALESVFEILRPEIRKKQIRLDIHSEPLPAVLAQPGKINQAFLNVLGNAVEACTAGGTIRVRARPEDQKGVLIEIEDNGCGIRPEDLPNIFEPFFTTKPIGQGTGLGLALSFGVVREHGGTIEVDSVVGKGSTFRIRLPLDRISPPGGSISP
jgi:signal transduction histidine kinase